MWNIVSLVISDCNVNFVVLQDARMSNVCLDRKPKHKKGSRFWKWRWYKRHKTNEGKIVLAHNTANSNRENLGQQPPVGDWSCKWKLTKIVEVQTIVLFNTSSETKFSHNGVNALYLGEATKHDWQSTCQYMEVSTNFLVLYLRISALLPVTIFQNFLFYKLKKG